jgi:hypothetical protein
LTRSVTAILSACTIFMVASRRGHGALARAKFDGTVEKFEIEAFPCQGFGPARFTWARCQTQ